MDATALKRLPLNGSRPSVENFCLVRLPNENVISLRPKPHTTDPGRGWPSSNVADGTTVSLRTEHVVSFAELCRTKCSPSA